MASANDKKGPSASASAAVAAAPHRPDAAAPAETPKEKDTPLPWDQLSILCVVLLTESICSTVLIPFVPSFIAKIKNWNVDEAGFAAGFPVGLFMLGQVLSGKMWGTFSDTVGRKLSISVGVLGCAVCMFFFGCSNSLVGLCFWRFMHGLSAGCSIVAKTMINDLTDITNRAKGLALVSLTWGVGTLFGPAAGGYLYDPANNSAVAFLGISESSFVGRNPAFLPSATVAAYNLFAVVISVMFLRESNQAARPLRDVLPPWLVKVAGPVIEFLQPKLPCDAVSAVDVTVVCDDGHEHDEAAHPSKGPAPPSTSASVPSAPAAAPHTSFGFKQAFQNPLLRRVCVISMLISTSDMVFAQIFPLWLAAAVAAGGLQLSPASMANLVLVNSGPAVLANIVFAKAIQLSGGPIPLWIGSQLVYALLTAVMPIGHSLGSSAGFWYTMVVGMLRKVVECWSFGLIMVVVSLTSPPGKVGIMFGIQQSTACMVRCVVPFIFAPLFAWSIEKVRPFPFNQYFVFLLCVIPLSISAYMSARVYVPADNGGDGHGEEDEDVESSDNTGAASETERRSSFDSARGSIRSRHSFYGPATGEAHERESLLQNSFANLANSFATNIIPGVVQNTILAVPVGAALQVSEEPDAQDEAGPHVRQGSDSRDNSSQEGDDVDDDAEYASVAAEMAEVPPATPAGDLEREDVRIVERSSALQDEELPL